MAEQTNLYPLCIPPTYVEDVFEAEYSLEDWQHALALLTNLIELSTHIENETVTLALWESGGPSQDRDPEAQ
jgi:hypothetical protein